MIPCKKCGAHMGFVKVCPKLIGKCTGCGAMHFDITVDLGEPLSALEEWNIKDPKRKL